MSLSPGAKLAHYEILESIGQGGMGQVYRARDRKLDRDVAIKVLPDEFASDPERLARFEREARLLASLNHPNIAGVYGFEKNAIVLELVEGETLAERIKRAPIPVDEAIAIATQIAEALEAGHEAGVIHRDLKPANIKLKEDGTVKVLDYGLAKALEGDAPRSTDEALSQSPTATRQGTKIGVILGTAPYMSPEQATGKRVDKRTDVWAFGAVLYEMLTTKRAFLGHDVSEVLASVIKSEPDWSLIPSDVPASVRRLLHRCLQKAPKARLRDIGDAWLELSDLPEGIDAPENQGSVPPTAKRWIPWGIASAAFFAAGVGLVGPVHDRGEFRALEVAPPLGTSFSGFSEGSGRMAFALSPDGRELAFVARNDDGTDELHVRRIGSLQSRKLADGARQPFWSPDGEHLGFFTKEQELMRVPRVGGPPRKLATVGSGVGSGTWNADGTILFFQGNGPISRISDEGGAPEPVTEFDVERGETVHRWPEFLPGGDKFLYFARSYRSEHSAVVIGSLDGRAPRVLFENRSAATYSNGYVLFVLNGVLLARAFELESGELGDTTLTIAGNVEETRYSNPVLSVSENGVIAYGTGSERQRLVWFERSGLRVGALGEIDEAAAVHDFRISPDDAKVAAGWLDPGGNGSHLWLGDVDRGTWRRLTFDTTHHLAPEWSPDGRELAYSSPARGNWSVFVRSIEDSSEPRELWRGDTWLPLVSDWSAQGLIINHGEATSVVGPTGEVLRNLANERVRTREAVFSPDNKWIAYRTNEGGDMHVFAQAVSGAGTRVRVSPSVGREPRWRRPDEIVYRGTDGFYAVPVTVKAGELVVGEAQFLFATPMVAYDVARDHERFLVAVPQPEPGHITIETDWLSALR